MVVGASRQKGIEWVSLLVERTCEQQGSATCSSILYGMDVSQAHGPPHIPKRVVIGSCTSTSAISSGFGSDPFSSSLPEPQPGTASLLIQSEGAHKKNHLGPDAVVFGLAWSSFFRFKTKMKIGCFATSVS